MRDSVLTGLWSVLALGAQARACSYWSLLFFSFFSCTMITCPRSLTILNIIVDDQKNPFWISWCFWQKSQAGTFSDVSASNEKNSLKERLPESNTDKQSVLGPARTDIPRDACGTMYKVLDTLPSSGHDPGLNDWQDIFWFWASTRLSVVNPLPSGKSL